MEYNKLAVSKTFEVNATTGLIVELTEGKTSNTLSLWLQYKDEAGNWAHKGTKGANAIRIPMNKEVASFILDNVKIMNEVNTKFVPKEAASKVDVTTLTKAQLLEMLAKLDAPKVEVKKAAPKVEDVLDVDFANFAKLTKKQQLAILARMTK